MCECVCYVGDVCTSTICVCVCWYIWSKPLLLDMVTQQLRYSSGGIRFSDKHLLLAILVAGQQRQPMDSRQTSDGRRNNGRWHGTHRRNRIADGSDVAARDRSRNTRNNWSGGEHLAVGSVYCLISYVK